MMRSIGNDAIICPHCNYQYEVEDMQQSGNDIWGAANNDEPIDETCCSCGVDFYISASWNPVFKTYKTEYDRDYS